MRLSSPNRVTGAPRLFAVPPPGVPAAADPPPAEASNRPLQRECARPAQGVSAHKSKSPRHAPVRFDAPDFATLEKERAQYKAVGLAPHTISELPGALFCRVINDRPDGQALLGNRIGQIVQDLAAGIGLDRKTVSRRWYQTWSF
jgi:hypothetical protein